MTTFDESDDMYERLLAINREAFEQHCYETAYHALTAALHRAKDVGSIQLLTRVQQIAAEQMILIDTNEPNHTLSSRSAAKRGAQSLYSLLASHAATRARIVAFQQPKKKERLHDEPTSPA